MAIPFSTLRDVKIHDNIGLNSNCVNAINYLSYGTNAKIGLPVDGKFEMLYHMNLGPDYQFTSWPGHNAVTIMLGGEAGKNLTIEGTNSLIEAEVDNLRHAYPAIGAFGVPCFKNWAQDPYAKGSYSASSTALYFNSDPSTVYPLICQYANPINENTFVFAGEHTIYGESNAHIEGAVKSGELAAEIIYPSKKQEKENCSIQ